MGGYDGAEICELVGLYVLSFLGKVYWIQNVGLRENSHFPIMSASGCKENFTYEQDLTLSKKVRQRKIIWFNPPYSLNVKTNIGEMFRKLFDKHFLKTSKLHKIFNRNNVKVSCSCLPNFANMIKSHNNRILSEQKTQDQPKCNC